MLDAQRESMESLRRQYLVEQTARHLRELLQAGGLVGDLPGLVRLAAELGVSKATLRGAVRMLESEGLVALSANGRKRLIIRQPAVDRRPVSIGILLYDALRNENTRIVQLLMDIQNRLAQLGFGCFLSTLDQCAAHHDVGRLSRYVKKAGADAWLVIAGSGELLEWFSQQATPCLAFAGRTRELAIASVRPTTPAAFLDAVRQLIGLGHRRIVFLSRRQTRLPEPSRPVLAFSEELASHGIAVGAYNLPDWEETGRGLRELLNSLFRVTPPTALIIEDVRLVQGVLMFLASRKIMVPGQVSLVAADDDPSFAWCQPSMAHITWEIEPISRRVVRWANAVRNGTKDLKQLKYPARFIAGGTMGPVFRG